MLVKDTWTALSLRVLSSEVSGMRVSSKKTLEGKNCGLSQHNPMKSKGQKQENQFMIGEGLTETQTLPVILGRFHSLVYQSAIWAVAHRLCRMVWKILHGGLCAVVTGISGSRGQSEGLIVSVV